MARYATNKPDLASLTADQLAEKVRGEYGRWREPALAELQTRANQYDRWNAAGALTVTALGERVQAAENATLAALAELQTRANDHKVAREGWETLEGRLEVAEARAEAAEKRVKELEAERG